MDFQFEILINDCFMDKKFILSLSNDYEDGDMKSFQILFGTVSNIQH